MGRDRAFTGQLHVTFSSKHGGEVFFCPEFE